MCHVSEGRWCQTCASHYNSGRYEEFESSNTPEAVILDKPSRRRQCVENGEARNRRVATVTHKPTASDNFEALRYTYEAVSASHTT